ncbi:unnamed protein product [uncultured bacterium]|nr:unnamed protein product [uncultured bacterium]
MRNTFAALLALSFASCAHVEIDKTYVATGAHSPQYIYIRPFSINSTVFAGSTAGGPGEASIRDSLAPAEFARILKAEMAKMAPTRILKSDEVAKTGWLISGEFIVLNGGSRTARGLAFGTPLGQSHIAMHVTVTDLDRHRVVYAFDLAGGSKFSSELGDNQSPGIGQAEPFDFQNCAEQIYLALSTNPFHYGIRTVPARYY